MAANATIPIAKGNIGSETGKQTAIKRKQEEWKSEKTELLPTRIPQYLMAAFQLDEWPEKHGNARCCYETHLNQL
ncbi:hypothetical protein ASV53_20580 [Photobacterium sanguinicancri]|uniref:Uncharacterized protein n=1 Tax=Photobacterium sanguinicancri TaxID=875932 RepID=A0ABX4FT19_9GAMM|nr:hypothetical protein ASV53_20580 [Photobacterium sanguinicancri]